MEQQLEALGFESLDILQPSCCWAGARRCARSSCSAVMFMPLVNPLLAGKYAT